MPSCLGAHLAGPCRGASAAGLAAACTPEQGWELVRQIFRGQPPAWTNPDKHNMWLDQPAEVFVEWLPSPATLNTSARWCSHMLHARFAQARRGAPNFCQTSVQPSSGTIGCSWALLRLRLRRIYWPRRVLGGACPTLTLQQIAICQHAGHGNDASCETRLHALQEGNSLPNSGVPWACAWQLP